ELRPHASMASGPSAVAISLATGRSPPPPQRRKRAPIAAWRVRATATKWAAGQRLTGRLAPSWKATRGAPGGTPAAARKSAAQPVEVELPHPVDGRQPARHVGEVPLDQRDQLGVGMVLAQPDDGGRRLQEVAEAREVDDEDLPHARCSRT